MQIRGHNGFVAVADDGLAAFGGEDTLYRGRASKSIPGQRGGHERSVGVQGASSGGHTIITGEGDRIALLGNGDRTIRVDV